MPALTNDNEALNFRPSSEPDAHSQAALLLVESLIHGLMERGALASEEALSIVETAAEVKEELAELSWGSETRLLEAFALLARIETSLRVAMA